MAEICRTADSFIGLTGTLINGYASGLFYLLYRLFPSYMKLDGKEYKSITDFCKEYGVYKETFVTQEDYSVNRRAVTRKTQEQMLPGVSPILYTRFFLQNAVFLSLQDMGKELPEYVEIPCPIPMDNTVETEYIHLENTFRDWMRSVAKKNRWALSAFRNLLTVYPDQPYGQKPLIDRRENVIASPRDIGDIQDLWPKDDWVLKKATEKVRAGENVLIYTNWVRTDTQKKLRDLLKDQGCSTNILPASVAPAKREGWIQKQLDSGMRVLICNPTLVQTGLDLNEFTTIIYFDIAYNLFVFRQSSRRSWRINQKAPRIEVYLPYYTSTIQHRALNLMASKLCAATLIEGFNFSDEGLAAMGQCHDMTSELARELTNGIKTSVEDVAKAFGRMAILHRNSENAEDSHAADTQASKRQTKAAAPLSPLESAALLRARVAGTSEKQRAKPEPQAVKAEPVPETTVNVQLCFADLIPA